MNEVTVDSNSLSQHSVTDLQRERHIPRSPGAQRVNGILDGFVRRQVFQSVQFGKTRVGRMNHRIAWQGRVCRFALDIDAGAVLLPAFLPAPMPPQLLRELRCFMRSACANGARDQLDPRKGELRVFVHHGTLTLSITVRNNAYEYCTEQLVQLADEILNSFLDQPAYLDYRLNSLSKKGMEVR